MKFIIDTSSLLSLVRYYLNHDGDSFLFDFFKKKIEEGEIIIIDKVLEQCKYTAKGIIMDTLPYLRDKDFLKSVNLPYKTDDLVAPSPQKFLRQVDQNFTNLSIRRSKGITEEEFEAHKKKFLEDADARQIILGLNLKESGEEICIITEETGAANDNKLFKKIPQICSQLNLDTMPLPGLIKHYNIGVTFSGSENN